MTELPPGIVFAVCAEPFADGRRAVVFGDSTSPLAEELVRRGARQVQVFDPDPARASAAASGNRTQKIVISPLEDAEASIRTGAYDVAIVPDLLRAGPRTAVLSLARKGLAPRGLAFVAAQNPEAKVMLVPGPRPEKDQEPLGYYELYDTVAAHFDEVKMLGQTPFVGYAVVDFAADGEPDVSIDSDLVPGGAEEPEWFVACGSTEPAPLEAIQIVQIPASHVVASASTEVADALRAARAAEAHLIERVAELEVRLAEAPEPKAPGPSPERVLELETELSRRDERIRELEGRVGAAEASAEEAQREAAASLRKSKEASPDLEVLRKQAASARALEASVAALAHDKAELEERLRRRDAELAELMRVSAETAPPEEEVAALEAQLVERSEQLRKLEAELVEAERTGRQLVGELARRGPKAREAGSVSQHQPLTAENARLRADLEAAGWTIQELEGRLSGPS